MDGFSDNEETQVLMIAATNIISSLDTALLRAGRFDHKIEIKLPVANERAEILKIHLSNK